MTVTTDRERLAAVWAAFGCASNPDDFKESVREQMWAQVIEMATESAARANRVYRENRQLEDELRRLRALASDQQFGSRDA
jgi:hypothetical protein